MAYIFLDESGDLGFNFKNRKTSRFFVITALFVKNRASIEKIVNKIFHEFKQSGPKNHAGVLHCVKETPKTRKKLLNSLNAKDIHIVAIYLNKNTVYTRLHNEKHVLYNYVANILLNRIHDKRLIPTDADIELVASRRETNKFLNENFKNYLKTKLKNKLRLAIEIKSLSQEKCLQVVDFACWSIFRKYEHDDSSYYNLINSKIEEKSLF